MVRLQGTRVKIRGLRLGVRLSRIRSLSSFISILGCLEIFTIVLSIVWRSWVWPCSLSLSWPYPDTPRVRSRHSGRTPAHVRIQHTWTDKSKANSSLPKWLRGTAHFSSSTVCHPWQYWKTSNPIHPNTYKWAVHSNSQELAYHPAYTIIRSSLLSIIDFVEIGIAESICLTSLFDSLSAPNVTIGSNYVREAVFGTFCMPGLLIDFCNAWPR